MEISNFVKKMKIEVPYNPTKSLLCINPKESQSTRPVDAFTVKVLVPQTCSNETGTSQDAHQWTDVYVWNCEGLFSFTCFRLEDEIFGICGEVDGSGEFCIKQNKLYWKDKYYIVLTSILLEF